MTGDTKKEEIIKTVTKVTRKWDADCRDINPGTSQSGLSEVQIGGTFPSVANAGAWPIPGANVTGPISEACATNTGDHKAQDCGKEPG
ncbi:hypothetical protein JTB14_011959 [Gonioctena quinquepunctata]|nr:hypothetical protein JTB14_011959 [Gonioctena quinquepunctata]